MLTEQGFVQKATRRMSGDGPDIEDSIDSTVGSVERKVGWMESLIESSICLVRIKKRNVRIRLRRLRANAEQAPVIAQRPVAPIKETISQETSY